MEHAPGLGEVHCNLGRALLVGRRLQEALFQCGEAVRLAPDFAPAWNNLGNILRELGRTTEAKGYYIEALRLDPDLAFVHLNLGRIVQDEGRLKDAETWFRIALDLEPGSVEIRWSLANALEESGQLAEAAGLCEQALEIDAESAESHVCLGSVRHAQGRLDDATRHFLRAIRARPHYVPAHCSLGVVRKQMGDLEAAERSFRDVLRLPVRPHPGPSPSWRNCSGASCPRKIWPPSNDGSPTRSWPKPAGRNSISGPPRCSTPAATTPGPPSTFAGAGRSSCVREPSESGREYRPEDFDQYVDEMISACSPEFFARAGGFGLETDRPVFVFGLPRSGTTLTEQILAAHSRVHGAGELKLARSGFESLPALLGSPSPPEKCLGQVARETAGRIAREHLAGLDEINRDAPRVVDKMPENYLYLGSLAALFPRARFIHCRRDLRDTAVSCWSTNFREIRWADHPDYIAARFAAYRRLMDHWSATLPGPDPGSGLRGDRGRPGGDRPPTARLVRAGLGAGVPRLPRAAKPRQDGERHADPPADLHPLGRPVEELRRRTGPPLRMSGTTDPRRRDPFRKACGDRLSLPGERAGRRRVIRAARAPHRCLFGTSAILLDERLLFGCPPTFNLGYHMRHLMSAVAAVGLYAAMGTEAQAQYTQGYVQSPRRPFIGTSIRLGRSTRRQYRAVVPQYTRPPNSTGYQNRPYYGAYGYGNYSNGSTDGFPPFQGRRSR